jgi:cytochrome P450
MSLDTTARALDLPPSGHRQLKDLPGPRPWPLVGNVLQIKLSRMHQDIEALVKLYGPYYRAKLLKYDVLVVADPEAIAAIHRDRPEGFRRPALIGRVASEMGGVPGLFFSEGEAWKNQRRMVMASFAPHHIKAYFPSLLRVAERLQRRWRLAADGRKRIDLQSDLKRYTTDAIAGLAFGTEVNTLESDEHAIQAHLDAILAGVYRRGMAPFPYWRYISTPADRRLQRSLDAVGDAILSFVAQARARIDADPALRDNPSNLLEAMIAAADQPGSGVDDRDVQGNVSDLLFAGEDTTANTLAWMIHLLWRNPEALKRAEREVRGLVPRLADLRLQHLDEMPWLDACAQEAMRLKPVAPAASLEALKDTVVGDVFVPKGTLIWCVVRHNMLSDTLFPDAAAFQPQRWLPEATLPVTAPAKRANLPFGAGPRMCPGRYLALLEIKLAMAALLSGFDIMSVDTPDGGEAEERMSFTMNPVGVTMQLRARQT